MFCHRHLPAAELRFRGLTLRPLTPPDAPRILEAVHESLPELQRFLPFAHVPQTLEMQLERISGMQTANATGTEINLAVYETDRLVAATGLHPRVPLNENGTEIGWWVRSSEAGRGLATHITQALLVYCFEALKMDRVQIAHNPDNLASRRVIEKVGFVFEGLVRNCLPLSSHAGLSPRRDALSYALIPDDRPSLPWYAQACRELELTDQLGNQGFVHSG